MQSANDGTMAKPSVQFPRNLHNSPGTMGRVEHVVTQEEDSALKKELDVKARRIAELETRNEELTILAQVCMYTEYKRVSRLSM